jgi:hypothetical protein
MHLHVNEFKILNVHCFIQGFPCNLKVSLSLFAGHQPELSLYLSVPQQYERFFENYAYTVSNNL